MAQGKKTSAEKKAKILKEKITNIDSTIRDIEKKTGVSKSVVANILKENLGKLRTESQVIADIIDGDKLILEVGGIIEQQHFFNILDKISKGEILETTEIKVLADIREKAGKRYSLLQGDITDEQGGIKDISTLEKLNNL